MISKNFSQVLILWYLKMVNNNAISSRKRKKSLSMTASMNSRNLRFLMKITCGTVANAKNMFKQLKS